MKIDMHIHTINSGCSINPINLLKKLCNSKKITPIIADHNYLTKLDFSINGEEIATDKGEFIGAFITEQVNDKDLFEAMDKVKEQGGIIYLPHPFDSCRSRSFINFGVLENKEFIKKVDVVEVFNSRCLNNNPNIMAKNYAEKYNLLKGVGSDAHFPWELGNTYINIEEFDKDNPKEFLRNLKKANNDFSKNTYCSLANNINIKYLSKLSKKIHKSKYFKYIHNHRKNKYIKEEH